MPGNKHLLQMNSETLHRIEQQISACRLCPLAQSRNNTVPGTGPAPARVMLVGEAPGREEDLSGKPFVGRAGKLLDQALALAAVLFNWGEYTVHRHFGHHKRKNRIGALFYKRHTGDHHSFFVEGQMLPESARDWRVIFFPAWLIVIYSGVTTAVWWAISRFEGNVAALVAFTLLAGYLTYEIFHACEHLPGTNPLARLPWIRTMRRRHIVHHRRDLMQTHNFNLTFPLMDLLYGTLYPESESESGRRDGPDA